MSLGSRIAIALVALMSAGLFGFMGLNPGVAPAPPVAFWGMSAFCLLIAIACLVKSLRGPALRMIGAAVFTLFVFYVYDSWGTDNLLRAVAGFVLLGVPFGFLAITGKYPEWGRFGEAVSVINESNKNQPASTEADSD